MAFPPSEVLWAPEPASNLELTGSPMVIRPAGSDSTFVLAALASPPNTETIYIYIIYISICLFLFRFLLSLFGGAPSSVRSWRLSLSAVSSSSPSLPPSPLPFRFYTTSITHKSFACCVRDSPPFPPSPSAPLALMILQFSTFAAATSRVKALSSPRGLFSSPHY